MTETLEPVAAADGSPLARLFAIVGEIDTADEAEQRDAAELAAGHHLYTQYADTLDRALDQDDWTGHPAVKNLRLGSSAVAWLHGGLWLHHTHGRETDEDRDVLTLIVPCSCGRGYVPYELENEDDLLKILTGLRPTGGHVTHEPGSGECDSVIDLLAQTHK
ncbi:hypothetical protein [Streptomyces sp. NPDC060366]|uniref:hypothetical protein n=1 Tax=Streptomyces sp. NPDC060366 TaxID=3347105 RepID=UPI0036593385